MKFYIILLSILMSYFQIFGIDFKDDKFNLNISYNDLNWVKVPGEKFRNRLVLKHINQPVTLNIIAYKFNEVITANGLVEKRINAIFDGWQLITNKELKNLDLKKLNVKEGLGSIYRKPYLDDSLNQNYRVVAEMCMVAGEDSKLGVIINLEAETMQSMLDTKSEFDEAYDSFWYGKERPNFYFIKNNQSEWVMNNQNIYRSRFNKIKYQLFDSIKVLNDEPVSKNITFLKGTQLYNKNANFLQDDKNMFLIDNIGNLTKFKIDTHNKDIILVDDGLFLISKKSNLKITKYDFNFNVVEKIEHNERVNDVFYNNNFFIFLSDSKIEMVKDGKVVWTLSHNFKISHYTAYNDILIITNDRDTSIKAINLNDGKIFASMENFNQLGTTKEEGAPKKYQFSDILIQDKYLIVTGTRDSMYGKRYALASINLEELEIGELDIRGFTKASLIGATNDFLVIHYQKKGSDQMYLEALDFNTFEIVWSINFDNMSDISLTSKQIIALKNNESIVSFNIKNAKKISEINLLKILDKNFEPNQVNQSKVSRIFLLNSSIASIISKNSFQNQLTVFR